MIPARWPRPDALAERLLHVDPGSDSLTDATIGDLPQLLRAGDLLVVNDAATLPASLAGRTPDGAAVEVRLMGELGAGLFRALLFGGGDWRTPTEHRERPPLLPAGAALVFGEGALRAVVERLTPLSSRLVDLRFDRTGPALWSALYRVGRPVQYAYTDGPLELWHVQVPYASRPWAVEMPSAGRPLRWESLLALRARGVQLAAITHAAGLSSTGSDALDRALPIPERFEVPPATAQAVARAREKRGRVVAVGTSVVRALESAAASGAIAAGGGFTDLLIGPGYRPLVVDGLLTGVHERTASHYALLHAFAPAELLDRATAHSEARGYLTHEFGDSWLILRRQSCRGPEESPT